MNKRLDHLKKYKAEIERVGGESWVEYKKTVDAIAEIEAVEHYDFMMRGDREIFLAIMDRLGVRLEPPFNRDYTAGSR